MLVSEIKLNETSSQQMLECTVCETQISQYMTVIPVLCGDLCAFFIYCLLGCDWCIDAGVLNLRPVVLKLLPPL